MKVLFAGVVVGIVAIAAYVLATAGATFEQMAMVVGNL